MAQNTSRTKSNGGYDPNAGFVARGEQAKVLDKITPPPNSNKPTGRGIATNLVKITEPVAFPIPEKS